MKKLLLVFLASVLVAVPFLPGNIEAKEDLALFQLQELNLATRFRLIKDSEGEITNNQMQYRFSLTGRFNLDQEAVNTITFRLTSGNGFGNMWNNTGLGTPDDATLDMAVRHLYFTTKPSKGLTISVGSLDFNLGESSPITAYTSEGYYVGTRVSLQRPDLVNLDEISLSVGYLGDLKRPDAFSRLHRLTEFNFAEILARKSFGDRVALSLAFSSYRDSLVMREGITLNTKELLVIDKLHAEAYQRITPDSDYGFALWGEKKIGRFGANAGYASIDPLFGGLNDGRYGIGNRVFTGLSYDLTQALSVRVFYTHAFDSRFKVGNEDRVDAVLAYDFMPLVTGHK